MLLTCNRKTGPLSFPQWAWSPSLTLCSFGEQVWTARWCLQLNWLILVIVVFPLMSFGCSASTLWFTEFPNVQKALLVAKVTLNSVSSVSHAARTLSLKHWGMLVVYPIRTGVLDRWKAGAWGEINAGGEQRLCHARTSTVRVGNRTGLRSLYIHHARDYEIEEKTLRKLRREKESDQARVNPRLAFCG